jgi:hypothetical protein
MIFFSSCAASHRLPRFFLLRGMAASLGLSALHVCAARARGRMATSECPSGFHCFSRSFYKCGAQTAWGQESHAPIGVTVSQGSHRKSMFADFVDLPRAILLRADVEKIFRNGITAAVRGRQPLSGYPGDAGPDGGLRAEGGARVGLHAAGLLGDRRRRALRYANWIERLSVAAGCGGGSYCLGAPTARVRNPPFWSRRSTCRNSPPFAPALFQGERGEDPARSGNYRRD